MTAFPLNRGLREPKRGKMSGPMREYVGIMLESVEHCVVTGDARPAFGMVDAIGTEMSTTFGHTRILRLYRDEDAAQAAIRRWRRRRRAAATAGCPCAPTG